jgi:hypothetical protein
MQPEGGVKEVSRLRQEASAFAGPTADKTAGKQVSVFRFRQAEQEANMEAMLWILMAALLSLATAMVAMASGNGRLVVITRSRVSHDR